MYTHKRVLLFLLIAVTLSESIVFAYGDPGSGAMLWQLLLAASFGVMFYIKRIIVWARGMTKGAAANQDNKEEINPEPVE